MSLKSEFFECWCKGDEHTLRFTYDEYCIFTSVFLNDWQPWYKRIWVGVKYIFGYKCQNGHWDVWMLNQDDLDRLEKLVAEFKATRKPE